MTPSPGSPAIPYLFAVIAVVLAALARILVDPLVGTGLPFATFFVAVSAVALLGSLGAALFATVLSAIVSDYLFLPPRLSMSPLGVPEMVSLVLFVVTGGIISILADRFNRTRSRLIATARSESEQRLQVQQERARLQAIIQSIPGVVWEAWGQPDSDDQRIDYVSDYVERMVGYSTAEWLAQPNFWLQLVPPDERDEVGKVAAASFASGQGGENEFRWLTKDGRAIWVLSRSAVIKDERGQPAGMRGVTLDITARKEAERQLALLAEISTTGLVTASFSELAHQIARRTADVIGDYCLIRILRDRRLDCIAHAHVSPEAEPLIRELASHAVVLEVSPLYAELARHRRTIVDNAVAESAYAHVRREGLDALFDRFRARRGILVPMLSQGQLLGTLAIGRASGAPYSESDRRLVEAIAARAALALDNARLVETAQRDADEARRARAAAEEAGRVKDEFLATLSHELRTPLNAILGWAHMLNDPALPAERREAAIQTIVRNARSQEQLIADILDVQRIITGKIRLSVASVNLADTIRAAVGTVQPSADAKHLRLHLRLDDGVPAIAGDADRLKQVVWNLLSNAIKFSPPGGRVGVRLAGGDANCEIVVEDDGPGIAPEFMPYVFERFRQADSSTTRTHKGLGLGLAIVRSLVEMHGGSIAAGNRADPETGAVFTIRLPHHSALPHATIDDEGTAMEPVPLWLEDAPSLAGLTVLVVEDDPDGRELIRTVLARCGATVVVASSAAEGFRLFTEQRPRVLISDIEMPGEDGYMLIRRVRALPAGSGGTVPAAAVTAYASPGDRMRVLGAGFNMHVAKPVQPGELALAVASLAGRGR